MAAGRLHHVNCHVRQVGSLLENLNARGLGRSCSHPVRRISNLAHHCRPRQKGPRLTAANGDEITIRARILVLQRKPVA